MTNQMTGLELEHDGTGNLDAALEAALRTLMARPGWRTGYLHTAQLSVYLRKGLHLVEGQGKKTLDLANVRVKEPFRGKGVYGALLRAVERIAWEEGRSVYVELVHDESQHGIYLRRGYRKHYPPGSEPSTDTCFVKNGPC